VVFWVKIHKSEVHEMKKRALSLVLVLLVAIAAFPAATAAAQTAANDNSHPFAIALREYMDGYSGIIHAYLAALDDSGTLGVLAVRATTATLVDYDANLYRYGVEATLFYLHNGEVLSFNANGLSVQGIHNRLVRILHAHTHTIEIIYTLESGAIVESTRIEYFEDSYLYYLVGAGARELIAERNALRARYGLIAPPPAWDAWTLHLNYHQTDQILAMTADSSISVTINGMRVNFADQQPTIIGERTLVPVRGVFEALGFAVGWDGEARQVTLTRASDAIIITINSATFTVNGRVHTLDVPAQIIGGSTMLPIRAPLEAAGYNVGWDGDSQTVIITTN
jgi:hypothetical protein